MKCVVIKEPKKACLEDRPLPPLKEGFARVRVKAAAICATDLEVLEGNIAKLKARYPEGFDTERSIHREK